MKYKTRVQEALTPGSTTYNDAEALRKILTDLSEFIEHVQDTSAGMRRLDAAIASTDEAMSALSGLSFKTIGQMETMLAQWEGEE